MRTALLTLFVFLAFASNAQLIGSKKQAFTQNTRAKYAYINYPLTDLQFFTSHEILLKRELPKTQDTKVNTKKGRVAFENGRAFEYYELVENAACVFESENEKQTELVVRFGTDADETLKFVLKQGVGNDENYYYGLDVKDDKKISFLGYEWELLSWENVRLIIKEKKNTKTKVSKTKSKGMKVDGTEKKGVMGIIKKD